MNLDRLKEKLIAAAQTNPPGDQVPYAFEKRIMAHLATVRRPDEWALWTRAWWYGAGASVAIAVFVSVWPFTPATEQDLAANFSQDLEQTILDSLDHGDNSW